MARIISTATRKKKTPAAAPAPTTGSEPVRAQPEVVSRFDIEPGDDYVKIELNGRKKRISLDPAFVERVVTPPRDVQVFRFTEPNAAQVWTKPARGEWLTMVVHSGGGAGGGGGWRKTSTAGDVGFQSASGGGGGAPGGCMIQTFPLSIMPTNLFVIVGAGGTAWDGAGNPGGLSYVSMAPVRVQHVTELARGVMGNGGVAGSSGGGGAAGGAAAGSNTSVQVFAAIPSMGRTIPQGRGSNSGSTTSTDSLLDGLDALVDATFGANIAHGGGGGGSTRITVGGAEGMGGGVENALPKTPARENGAHGYDGSELAAPLWAEYVPIDMLVRCGGAGGGGRNDGRGGNGGNGGLACGGGGGGGSGGEVFNDKSSGGNGGPGFVIMIVH